jgi:hypothetical protein
VSPWWILAYRKKKTPQLSPRRNRFHSVIA